MKVTAWRLHKVEAATLLLYWDFPASLGTPWVPSATEYRSAFPPTSLLCLKKCFLGLIQLSFVQYTVSKTAFGSWFFLIRCQDRLSWIAQLTSLFPYLQWAGQNFFPQPDPCLVNRCAHSAQILNATCCSRVFGIVRIQIVKSRVFVQNVLSLKNLLGSDTL